MSEQVSLSEQEKVVLRKGLELYSSDISKAVKAAGKVVAEKDAVTKFKQIIEMVEELRTKLL